MSILTEETFLGFFKGASASVLCECTYSALRMGLYDPIKYKYSALLNYDGSSPSVKWLFAFTSGAIGSAIFNLIDVVKVRFQTAGPNKQPPYLPYQIHYIPSILRRDCRGYLYIGTSATVIRAAFLTSAQLGSYDIIKSY